MKTLTFQVLEGSTRAASSATCRSRSPSAARKATSCGSTTSASAGSTPRSSIDDGDIILTDLESTNGTRVNGNVVQIRRLRAGDRVGVGRSHAPVRHHGGDRGPAARPSGRRQGGRPGGRPTVPGSAVPATTLASEMHDLGPTAGPTTETGRRLGRVSEHGHAAAAAEADPGAGGPAGRDLRLPAPRPDHRRREHPRQRGRHRGQARRSPTGRRSRPCRCSWPATCAPSPTRTHQANRRVAATTRTW